MSIHLAPSLSPSAHRQRSTSSMLPDGTTDAQLIAMWLAKSKGVRTQVEYQRDLDQFLDWTNTPIQDITLPILQRYQHLISLPTLGLAPATIKRKLNAIKSLLSFAQKTGYTSLNVGGMIEVPKVERRLAARILTEEQVYKLLAMEEHPRNHAILSLLYYAGIRVSELCSLIWGRVQLRGEDGFQITVWGKGEEERTVLVQKAGLYAELLALCQKEGERGREEPDSHTPLFLSRQGGQGLHIQQVENIVKAAATRAKLPQTMSPHWLRHAHASHAIERGAPLTLVQETLGHANPQTTSLYIHARPGSSSSTYLK